MQKLQTMRSDGFWFVAVAAMIWGTIGVATQAIYNVDSTTPLFINLSRALVASPILLMLCWRVLGKSMFRIVPRDFFMIGLSGTFLVLSQVAYLASIRSIGITLATLLTLCISPLIVVLVSVLLRLEVLNRRIIVALATALIGSTLLVGFNITTEINSNLIGGVLFALMAAACYAGMLLCGRSLANHCHPLQVTAIGFSTGTVVLLIINLVNGIHGLQTAQGWLLVLYLGIVPTAFAYWLFQSGLKTVSATSASILALLEPLVAALLAWLMFGESLSFSGMIGATLLLSSLFLLSERKAGNSAVT